MQEEVKVAILDLYNGIENQGISGFDEILKRFKAKHNINITWEVFDVRRLNKLPDTGFDIYISSGGPGSPFSEDEEWDKNYFKLIDLLEVYNASEQRPKKHCFFVCHSFQLMCRRYNLGEVSLRSSPSFGVLPVYFFNDGQTDSVFKGLADPFYAVDSRSWQVVNPDMDQFEKTGAKILAIEKERSHVDLPRALMAIRFNDYFIATQFHSEANPAGIRVQLLTEEKKKQVIAELGEDQYNEMLKEIGDPAKLSLTHATIFTNFLAEAVKSITASRRLTNERIG